MFHLPQGPTLLPRHPHGGMAFCREARLIEDHHPPRVSPLFMHQAMVRAEHRGVIPDRVTDAALPRPYGPTLSLEGHGFDRLAFPITALAPHIVAELIPGLGPGQAIGNGGMNAVPCVPNAFDIVGIKRQLRDREHVPCGPTRWSHPLPPRRERVIWKQRIGQRGSW